MSKIISNEEYEVALKNEQNMSIMNKAASTYRFSIDPDELYRCKLIALWNALKRWKPGGRNFLSFLYQRVIWECLKLLAQQRRTRYNNTYPIIYDIESESSPVDRDDVHRLIDILPTSELKNVIIQKYVYNMTLMEIGSLNNFSYETARRKIRTAIKYLKSNLLY